MSSNKDSINMITAIVVEDENKIREGFLRILNWEEFDIEIVGTARNGLEGLNLIKNLEPDIAFVDLNMPVMDGMELLEKTFSKYETKSIIISGYSDFTYAQEALRYNVFDYLLKPVDKDELISVINRYHTLNNKELSQEKIINILNDFFELPINNKNIIVNNSIKYIEKNLEEKINATIMSEYLNISVSKLNYIFKEELSMTFHKFLTLYRIRMALEMLAFSDDMVYEIGMKVGFPNYQYFSDIFKKTVGITTSDFRTEITKKNNINLNQNK